MLKKGYVSLILHAHLPYVRHPEYPYFLEEQWFFEAMNETYIPLIEVFDKLLEENVDFRITMSLTPTLLSMMSDSLLLERFEKYLRSRIELAEKEVERTKNMYQLSEVSKMYFNQYNRNLEIFSDRYHGNLISAFKKFYDMGNLEILACAATHGYLPLMETVPEAIYAQVQIGIETHKKFFGRPPKGIWLPECGYTRVLDTILKSQGILYTILETHGILYAQPRPLYGVYAPICTPDGIAVFGRDMESSKQVWSSTEGYPGDYDYREFYRDIGYELDKEYLESYILPGGHRSFTGLKYYKITGETDNKHVYIPENAKEKAAIHAGNFMFNRECQISYLSDHMDKPPLVVCPYDAELFGHWWYEGPIWLYYLIKKAYYDQNTFSFINPTEYLEKYPVMQIAQPCPSSWGYQGYNEVWLNDTNSWIYPHLHEMAWRMRRMANIYKNAQGLLLRALNQALRELLLAQSSDWAFIMNTGTMVQYAHYRTKLHISRFNSLYEQIQAQKVHESFLADLEWSDPIFPDLHYSVFQSEHVQFTHHYAFQEFAV